MLNKVQLIGYLGADPEVRYTPAGDPVTTFRIATSDVWKDKDGNKQERTEWHRIVAWQRLAEICDEYLRKGAKVYVEGKNITRKWTDKDGVDRYTTEIIARDMKMLDAKSTAPVDGVPPGENGEPPLPDPSDDTPF